MLATQQFDGLVLHASPKSKDTLEELEKEVNQISNGRVKTRVVLADLSDPVHVSFMISSINDLKISFLLNNAGFGANGQFDKISLDTQLKMIAVNCSALVQLTHFVVQKHRESLNASKNDSKKSSLAIVNISSVAAAPCGLPWQTTYAATKSFVSSFSNGIAYSLKDDGVKVLLVEPGTIVDTGFQDRSMQPKHSGSNTPQSVISSIIDNLNTSNSYHRIVPAFHDKITYYASKFLPDRIILKLGAKRGLKYSPEELR
jgi:short-subunit dehydrogenase